VNILYLFSSVKPNFQLHAPSEGANGSDHQEEADNLRPVGAFGQFAFNSQRRSQWHLAEASHQTDYRRSDP
jgi:hypothetical protein